MAATGADLFAREMTTFPDLSVLFSGLSVWFLIVESIIPR